MTLVVDNWGDEKEIKIKNEKISPEKGNYYCKGAEEIEMVWTILRTKKE